MRIALLHPTYWPEVRRGAERLAHDLATALSSRGHDVTILTAHAGATVTDHEDGFRVVRDRRAPEEWLERLGFDRHLSRGPRLIGRLLRGRYDVAHALTHTDGWIAGRARALGGPPVLVSLLGLPTPRSLGHRRLRASMLRDAMRRAEVVTVLSEAAAQELRRGVGFEAHVVPAGVFTADFAVSAQRAEAPTLICAASLDDPRKRGALLLRAFASVRDRLPDARLLLAGRGTPSADRLPAGAELVRADATVDLARYYASAWASVLPAVDEAFGLVLAESLAAGTPAVAAASGAVPDVVADDAVGRLFRPDDEADLVRALHEVLNLRGGTSTAAACRARASEWDWEAVAPRYEALYEETVKGSGRGVHGYSRSP